MATEKARQWYVTEVQKIWVKYNCNPVRSMMPLFANGFVFVSFFISLRGLSEMKVLFSGGGTSLQLLIGSIDVL